jgi:hypothetical protein
LELFNKAPSPPRPFLLDLVFFARDGILTVDADTLSEYWLTLLQ